MTMMKKELSTSSEEDTPPLLGTKTAGLPDAASNLSTSKHADTTKRRKTI